MTTRAPINPQSLVWAREVGHVTVEELATAAGVKPAKVEEFECGEALPTFRQLTLLATKLDRTPAFFFAPPPKVSDVPGAADFRGRAHAVLPADLAKEMRRAEQYRDTMLELNGSPKQHLTVGAIDWGNLAVRAAELRNQFGLAKTFVPPDAENSKGFNFWRGFVESHGTLVLQTTKISLDTFRGLSVYHEDLSIVVINGADSAAGRIFTLFHELAHLISRTSGLCALQDSVDEEALANDFAAHFLMPETEVRINLQPNEEAFTAVKHLAQHFKVSNLAAAVRLRRLNIISDDTLDQVRIDSDNTWARAREAKKKSKSTVPPWRLRYRDLGPSYVGSVARALEDKRVDLVDASYLLNARVPMVEQMLNEYYRTGTVE